MNAATFQLSPKQFFFWGVLFALIQAVCIASEWYFIALLPFIVIIVNFVIVTTFVLVAMVVVVIVFG